MYIIYMDATAEVRTVAKSRAKNEIIVKFMIKLLCTTIAITSTFLIIIHNNNDTIQSSISVNGCFLLLERNFFNFIVYYHANWTGVYIQLMHATLYWSDSNINNHNIAQRNDNNIVCFIAFLHT